jgi:SAM-dependent methyltransferase
MKWFFKILAKILITQLRLPRRLFKEIGIFRHGAMDNCDYARRIYELHKNALCIPSKGSPVIMELGPGDSVYTAIFAFNDGMSSILVDSGPYAESRLTGYIRRVESDPPHDSGESKAPKDFGWLTDFNSQYLTGGLTSLRRIDGGSVDFIFSNAVLEHVLYDEFDEVVLELFRILRPGGRCSHRVDLKDHLDRGLNNLRFPARVWESKVFRNSGFYTNRLRYSEILRKFESAGFTIVDSTLERWEELPISRSRLASEFRAVPIDELRVSGFSFIAKK